MKNWQVACAALVAACGGASHSGNGQVSATSDAGTDTDAGTNVPGTVSVTVNLVGTGAGRIVSSPPGIDCPGTCAMSVSAGTALTFSATSNATSHFEGFGGGCSGKSCAFAPAANTIVYANFGAGATRILTVVVNGNGTVTSVPPGISCPGTCTAAFPEGSSVDLTESPGAHGGFVAWTGACSGNAGCTVSLGADAAVTAGFATLDPAPCAAFMPTLPAAQSLTAAAPAGSKLACIAATVDGAGNVYIRGDYTPSGGAATRGVFGAAGEVESVALDETNGLGPFPLQSGFAVFTEQKDSAPKYVGYGPDGAVLNSNVEPPATTSIFGDDANGGTVLLSCTGTAGALYTVTRYDDTAKQISQFQWDEAGTVGCLQLFSVMVDAQGNTLAVVRDRSNNLQAQWLDTSGKQLNPTWFKVGTIAASALPGDATLLARPLIGGGAALRINGVWSATLGSGAASVQPAPAFFEEGKDVLIVLGSKAYAMVPDPSGAGTIDVVEPGGKVCESLATATAADMYSIGKGGTLLDLHGDSSCTATYYPHVLR